MIVKWWGKRRFYNDNEIDKWSDRIYGLNWLPLIDEFTEEEEDGRRKQRYILVDDIPSQYRDDFLIDETPQQLERRIRKENEIVIEDVVTQCVERRVWERWFRKRLQTGG